MLKKLSAIILENEHDYEMNINWLLAFLDLQKKKKMKAIMYLIGAPGLIEQIDQVFARSKIPWKNMQNLELCFSLRELRVRFLKRAMLNEFGRIIFTGFSRLFFESFLDINKNTPHVIYDIHMLGGVQEFLEAMAIPKQFQIKYLHYLFQAKKNLLKIYNIFPAFKKLYYYYGLSKGELINGKYPLYLPLYKGGVPAQSYIYSAGNHLRDYPVLLESLAKLPGHKALLRANNPEYRNLARDHLGCFYNKPINYLDFIKETAASKLVVLPLQDKANKCCGLSFLAHAMALGKPVIATACDSTKGYIQDGINGLLVSPANPTQLTLKMRLLLSDVKLAKKLGQNARKTVGKEMDLAKVLLKITN